ncbi:MAG: hypothetical protein R3C20_05635 [Planctomycetaceae bacterium]
MLVAYPKLSLHLRCSFPTVVGSRHSAARSAFATRMLCRQNGGKEWAELLQPLAKCPECLWRHTRVAKTRSTLHRAIARAFEPLIHFGRSRRLAHVLASLLVIMPRIVEDRVDQVFSLVGCQQLQDQHVELVVTYGDPAFYSKVGFRSISPQTIRPPFELSQPEGWLGQSLNSTPVEEFRGHCQCVAALSDAAYW